MKTIFKKNCSKFLVWIGKEKLHLGVSLVLILLSGAVLSISPVHKIDLTLADATYLNILSPNNIFTLRKTPPNESALPCFKRLKLFLPYIIRTKAISIELEAVNNVHPFTVLISHKKRGWGRFNFATTELKKYLLRKVHDPAFYNAPLDITLLSTHPPELLPHFFVRNIKIKSSEEAGYFQRSISYLVCIALYQVLFHILILIAFKNKRVRYICLIGTSLLFLSIGLLASEISFVLSTILVPVVLTTLLLSLLIFIAQKIKTLNLTRWQIAKIVLMSTIGLIFWSAATFHPQHYHPDIKSHIYWSNTAIEKPMHQFVDEFSRYHVGVWLGIDTPFPYSPAFHLAVMYLNNLKSDLGFWIRFIPVLSVILILPLLYIVTWKKSHSEFLSTLTSLIFLFNGIVVVRLLYYLYPALFGGFFIMSATLMLLHRAEEYAIRHKSAWYLPEIILVTAGLIVYPSGPFCLGMLSFTLLILWSCQSENRRNKLISWVKIFIPSSLLSMILYYGWYIPDMITKIIPRLLQKGREGNRLFASGEAILERLDGVFGTWIVFLVAIIGFSLLMKNTRTKVRRSIMIGWCLSWLFLFLTRFIAPIATLFKSSKDFVFLWPLFSFSYAYFIFYFHEKKKWKLLSIAGVVILVVGFILIWLLTAPRTFI